MLTMRMVEDSYQSALKEKEKLARNKSNKIEETVEEDTSELSERNSRNPILKKESIKVIQKEEEVPKVDNMVEETLFLEEEEEAEEEK
jgi:hypothetical protein